MAATRPILASTTPCSWLATVCHHAMRPVMAVTMVDRLCDPSCVVGLLSHPFRRLLYVQARTLRWETTGWFATAGRRSGARPATSVCTAATLPTPCAAPTSLLRMALAATTGRLPSLCAALAAFCTTMCTLLFERVVRWHNDINHRLLVSWQSCTVSAIQLPFNCHADHALNCPMMV